MNFIDRVILSLSPESAQRRLLARKKIEFLQSYEGGTKGRRSNGWKNSNTSADTEIRRAGSTMRARARDLVRNDPWAARCKMVIVNNTIGSGIVPSIPVKGSAKAWEQWAETTACDSDGFLDFYGIQDIVLNTVVESGECLVRRVYTNAGKKKIPLKLQVLEPDHLANRLDGSISSDKTIVQGKEYNAAGELTHYHLYTEHPGDSYRQSIAIERVPAKDIIHVYKKERPGQSNGVTWYAPIIVRMNDFAEYEDAQLVKQKISSKWAAFVYDKDMPTTTQAAAEMSEVIEAGAIEFLPPGKDITFPNMPSSGNYIEYSKMQLHAFAAAMGITYESLTGFYDDTNFASGRMGWVEMNRNIQAYRRKMVIPQLCRGVFQWFMEASEIAGVPTVSSVMDVTWTPPRREMFDPVKETKGQKDAIRMGTKTLTGTMLENGDSPDKIFAQHVEDQKILDRYGLKFESDYRNDLLMEGNENADETVSTKAKE